MSLTLIAPAGLGPQIDAETLIGITRASHPTSLAPWLRNLVADPKTISDHYAAAAFRQRTDPAMRAAQADMANALFRDGTQTFDLRPALARLQVPAQIVWGRQDRVLPFQQALAARGEFGLHLVEGAGHLPHYEVPERIARIAMRFMAGVEAST
ncbi:alpha/beta fold hydrolase [uncultured Devosia sp.]|uniref:alpha/beta fold hydrolase n=1 Tax=uncultured Devosia sp. TaxID=211434 RepID=UPI0035CC908E